MAEALSRLDTVKACKAIPWSHRLTIDFRPENGVADWFIDQAERSFEDLLASETPPSQSATLVAETHTHESVTQVATGPAKWLYFALGGGALVMTVVGLIVPGIPTVPFLLLSSYGFARSSPRMNTWLRESRFFGPILTEWEQYGGLSLASKKKLISLTIVIVLIAVILAPVAPLGLVLIVLIASLSTYGLTRMPGIPGDPNPASPGAGPGPLALAGS